MNKYERLIYIINLIQTNRNQTANVLARKCGVSKRTIYRDILTLSQANMPIYYDDGYRLLRSSMTPPISLNEREVAILNLAVNSSPMLSLTSLGQETEKVLAKINSRIINGADGDLPEVIPAIKVESSVSVGQMHSRELFAIIEDSINRQRISTLTYTDMKGKNSKRLIHPYHILFRHHAFYLLAYCEQRNDYRLFRLERIRDYEINREKFKPDLNFNLEKYFRYSWGVAGGKPHDIKIRFSKEVAYIIRSGKRHTTEKITNLRGGAVEYRLRASGLEEIARWVIGFGGYAKIISPLKLAEIVHELATGACGQYLKKDDITRCPIMVSLTDSISAA